MVGYHLLGVSPVVGYHLHLHPAELNKLFIRSKAKEATASSVSMVVISLPMPLYYWGPFPDFYMILCNRKEVSVVYPIHQLGTDLGAVLMSN